MTGLADRLIRRAPPVRMLVPGVAPFAVGVLMAAIDGGYPPGVWYLAALFLLGVLVLTAALAPPQRDERGRLFEAALAAYAGFCLWSYLSIAWADVRGVAWDGANRTLLYGVVLALVGLRPWTRAPARTALAIVGAGTAAIAAAVLLVSALVDDPARLFLEGRLSAPTGYANATAALWLIAFWPAIEMASGHARRWPVRGLGLAAASLLLQMALLSQSRGAAIAFAVTGALFVAMTPRRWPALLSLAAACALAAVAWDALVAVHEVSSASAIGPALAGARSTIAVSCAAAFLAGAAAGLAGSRLAAVAGRPAILRAGRYGFVVLLTGATAASALAVGDPRKWADARWHDFRSAGYREVEDGGSRFEGSLGSNRYDFYRVAVNQFREHPVAGIGADNFVVPYLLERRSPEAPRYPHSLAMRLIAQLGTVGTGLFLLFLGLVLASVTRAMRRAPPLEAGLAASATAGFVYWLVHGLADWLWEFAGLGVIAIALLALGGRLAAAPVGERSAEPPGGHVAPGVGRGGRLPRRLALAAAALGATISFVLPGAAARLERAAYASAGSDPAAALAKLDLAADLNPLSGQALAVRGIVARREGMTWTARQALEAALEREPRSWYIQLQLALLEARDRRLEAARERIEAAAALNPRQPLLRRLRHRLLRGARIDPEGLERELYEQRQAKLRPVDGSGR